MPTRRDILMRARQELSPTQRRDYCSQCYENARRQYDSGLVLPAAGALGFLGSLGPALVAQLLLGCPKTYMHYQASEIQPTPGSPPQQQLATTTSYECDRQKYDDDPLGLGINEEEKPFTDRGDKNAPVKVKQPAKHRNFMRTEQAGKQGMERGQKTPMPPRQEYDKGPAVNPWKVCTSSVGRENKDKYERCVMGVKAKSKIKKD